MLIIYVDKLTNRLGYTIGLLFRDILPTEYMLTTSKDQFIALNGAKMSYCDGKISHEFHISSSPLLFETDIYSMELNYSLQGDMPTIFSTSNTDDDLGFDIFAASFYLVSRYEEYLPFVRDEHGRFCVNDSILYQKNLYMKPIVNIWAEMLKKRLIEKYSDLTFKEHRFSFINTIDVDMAYCYKSKGFYRTVMGFCRDFKNRDFSACVDRIRVLFGVDKDPYDVFDYILGLLSKYKLKTIFFFLCSTRNKYDKNISPYNANFQFLIKKLSDFASIGIHPSYFSLEYPLQSVEQTKRISDIIHKDVTMSRFHYLRFRLPTSFRNLIDGGIKDEYSMGYAQHIGFRAGICSAYNFYDLERDSETKLRVHPFMFMDVALKNGLKFDREKSWEAIKQLIDEVKKVNGQMISIWHNESLSDYGQWEGWREIYERQIEYIENR